MNTPACPFLGAMDEAHNQQPGIDYPSFENRCFADAGHQAHHKYTPLMLADQATYCLSGQHQLCPRFQASQHTAAAYHPPTYDAHVANAIPRSSDIGAADFPTSDAWHTAPMAPHETMVGGVDSMEMNSAFPTEMEMGRAGDLFGDGWQSRRSPLWLGALSTFIFVFFCGISMALYTGWQLVTNNMLAAQPEPGTIVTLPAGQRTTEQVGEEYIVMTATSDAAAVSTDASTPLPSPTVGAVRVQPTPLPSYPQAVTPTPAANGDAQNVAPILVVTPQEQSSPVGANQADAPPANGSDNVPGNGVIVGNAPSANSIPAEQVVVVIPPTPTPRPAPVFDLPLNAPLPEVATATITATATLMATPTATLGPPFVIFKADENQLNAGECTTVRWEVRNVVEVFYEDRGVFGSGEEEACIGGEDEVYDLVVRLGDGTTKIYTTTVALILPTPTPLPSATFTPEPLPSPTWTPDPPTPTPTPDIQRGVALSVEGDSQRTCSPGATCEIGLLATNTGSGTDDLAVVIARSEGFSPQLCRQDGVCASDRLVFDGLGPTHIARVTVRLTIPADATPATLNYSFRAISILSGEQAMSEDVRVEIQIQ